MNEKYKNWLKKFGIAGFLFFLIKGILWLIFGTAIYNWLKTLAIMTIFFLLPNIGISQKLISTDDKKRTRLSWTQVPELHLNYFKDKNTKPFFCKLEDKIFTKYKTPLAIRLGSLDYSNQLEYCTARSNQK